MRQSSIPNHSVSCLSSNASHPSRNESARRLIRCAGFGGPSPSSSSTLCSADLEAHYLRSNTPCVLLSWEVPTSRSERQVILRAVSRACTAAHQRIYSVADSKFNFFSSQFFNSRKDGKI